MHISRLYMHNTLRNFNYIVACSETGDALVIDPLDANACLAEAKQHGWTIRQILNTHEHNDHTAGNRDLVAATGAQVLAHANAAKTIGGVNHGLQAGECIRVGNTIELQVLDTPGHTFSHVCLFAHADQPALFCGDTLFNAGVGHCRSGDPILLYESFAKQLTKLANNTLIYPGHDYLVNNLRFTLDREPSNHIAKDTLTNAEHYTGFCDVVNTLAEERDINVFLRLQSPDVIDTLRQQFSDFPAQPSSKDVFLKLRQLRDHW